MGGFEASLAKPLPAGAHLRPYPGATGSVLMLWEALHMDVVVAEPPPAEPELRGALFAELMLRGLSRMVPRLSEYLAADGSMQASVSVDGGYYTKTPTICRSSARRPAARAAHTSAPASPATA